MRKPRHFIDDVLGRVACFWCSGADQVTTYYCRFWGCPSALGSRILPPTIRRIIDDVLSRVNRLGNSGDGDTVWRFTRVLDQCYQPTTRCVTVSVLGRTFLNFKCLWDWSASVELPISAGHVAKREGTRSFFCLFLRFVKSHAEAITNIDDQG